MPKPDHRSQMARAWLHFHAARKGRGSGSAAPRVDWPVYPRRAEHNTVAEGGNRRWAETACRPVGLVELADDPEDCVRLCTTRPAATCLCSLDNGGLKAEKPGYFSRRSRPWPPDDASQPSLSGAKFGRRRLRSPAAPAVAGPLRLQDGRDEVLEGSESRP